MRVIVLTVGDELLSGRTLDTNFQYLARWLGARGHVVQRHDTVADRIPDIAVAIPRARSESDLVIVTGGLGGTPDDVTLDAVAAALGLGLRESPEVRRRVEASYAARAQRVPATALRIARVPDGARLLTNPVGQAPGVWLEPDGGPPLVLLPGVPPELRAIVEGDLSRSLAGDPAGERIVTLRTVGLGESTLAQALAEQGVGGDLAFLPEPGRVDVRIRIPASDPPPPAVSGMLARIREVIGDALIGDETATLEGVVGEALLTRGATVAVAESLTGGALGAAITRVPGSSGYFLGGVVAYSNDLKESALGVRRDTLVAHGAVSAQVAVEMAAGVRSRTGSDWALSTTGIAGPGGASAEKPLGLTYIGLALPDGRTHAVRHRFSGDRWMVVDRTVAAALNLLRRTLAGAPLPEEAT